MDKILLKFAIKRFMQGSIGAAMIIAASQSIEFGIENINYGYILTWSFITGLLLTSVASFYAYRKRCKLVYKDP